MFVYFCQEGLVDICLEFIFFIYIFENGLMRTFRRFFMAWGYFILVKKVCLIDLVDRPI